MAKVKQVERDRLQTRMDMRAIRLLRWMQHLATGALIMIGGMGFAEIVISARSFVAKLPIQWTQAAASNEESQGGDKARDTGKSIGNNEADSESKPDKITNVARAETDNRNDSSSPEAAPETTSGKLSPIAEEAPRKDVPRKRGEDDPIHIAFKGLEFLLLAPLFYLLLRSLTEYIGDLSLKDEQRLDNEDNWDTQLNRAASSSENELASTEEHRKRSEMGLGKECLLEAKALSFGLLFAIVATHLVGKLISGAYSNGDSSSWTEIGIGILLLVVIAAVYFGIELLAHRLRK